MNGSKSKQNAADIFITHKLENTKCVLACICVCVCGGGVIRERREKNFKYQINHVLSFHTCIKISASFMHTEMRLPVVNIPGSYKPSFLHT